MPCSAPPSCISTPRIAGRALARLKRIKRGAVLSDGRLEALTTLVLATGRPAEGFALLEEYKASPDPATAAMATLLSAQFHENAGELDEAIVDAERSYALAVQLQDTWGQASAAQGLTQLYSQLADRTAALDWAARAESGFIALQADSDLRELNWLVAMNAIATGDIERGRPILERFATETDESLGFDFLDLRAIGRSGLAEIDLATGKIDSGLRLYREAVAVFEAPRDHADALAEHRRRGLRHRAHPCRHTPTATSSTDSPASCGRASSSSTARDRRSRTGR